MWKTNIKRELNQMDLLTLPSITYDKLQAEKINIEDLLTSPFPYYLFLDMNNARANFDPNTQNIHREEVMHYIVGEVRELTKLEIKKLKLPNIRNKHLGFYLKGKPYTLIIEDRTLICEGEVLSINDFNSQTDNYYKNRIALMVFGKCQLKK